MIKKIRKGFTLIELLVVIAIIGLLSTLAVVALNNARLKARDAKRVADIKQIQTALELYYQENTAYPEQTAAAALALGAGSGINEQRCDGDGDDAASATAAECDTISSPNGIDSVVGATIYMGLIPEDPSNASAECVGGAVGTASTAPCVYSYITDTTTTDYEILFLLEGNTG